MARNKDGRLEVVVGGRDQAAWHRWQRREGGWSDWHSLERPAGVENAVTSTPVLAENHDGRLELFTLASDEAV